MSTNEVVTLQSGRRVALHRLAKGDGRRTIVFCHAAPGAGNFDPDPAVTAQRPITLIAIDRPGYGGSEPMKGDEPASVDRGAEDLAEVIRRESNGPVGVAGWSAGGRIALALAARHPDLVDRVAVIATPAPDEEVPWIPPNLKQGLEALRGLPPARLHRQFAAQLDEMLPAKSPLDAQLELLGRSPADDAVLKLPGATDRLVHMLTAAFAQGMTGLADDIIGYCLQPWGFEPAQVQAKVLCLYGAKDPVANSRHGSWWQKHLPNARLEMSPQAGHMLVIPMWQRVLSHLAPGLKQ